MRGYVLVGGWPASGKSTLSRALAVQLGVAYLSKDELKEALMSHDHTCARTLSPTRQRPLLRPLAPWGSSDGRTVKTTCQTMSALRLLPRCGSDRAQLVSC